MAIIVCEHQCSMISIFGSLGLFMHILPACLGFPLFGGHYSD